jgi:general secretion pathway protein E/type IV pilus assembly protein PilB
VVRLIDALLTDAVKRGASDLHFEPEAGFLRIRYRIDGLLRQIRALHKSCWPAMAVRIKVMAGLNIAETRAPRTAGSPSAGQRPAGGFPRLHPAHHPRREHRPAGTRPPEGIVDLDELGLSDPSSISSS